MKIIAVCASPRKGKNTEFGLTRVLESAREDCPEIETELISLAGKNIQPCKACGYCKDKLACSEKDDDFNSLIDTLTDFDALVLGSPVYMGSMTAQAKAFLDKSVMFRRNNYLWRNKYAAAVAVGGSRNGGQELTVQGIHSAFLIHDMIVVGDGGSTSHFGGIGWERVPGGIEQDADSLNTFSNLGKRLAGLLAPQ